MTVDDTVYAALVAVREAAGKLLHADRELDRAHALIELNAAYSRWKGAELDAEDRARGVMRST